MTTLHNISGSVERIITRNDSTSWSVLEVTVEGRSVTVVGLVPHVDEGLRIQAEGAWNRHPTFGDQFKAESIRLFAPVSKEGIARFLQSGAVHGIGKKFAGMIVDRFGEKTLQVIENDSWQLKWLKGVGPKRIEAVRKGVKEYRGRMETMSFLHGKLGAIRAQRVYDKYGDDSRRLVGENPYRLVEDFDGFGFLIADKVAQDVGIKGDHPLRLRASLFNVLKEAAKHGHTCVDTARCRDKVRALLGSDELADKAIQASSTAAGIEQVDNRGVSSLELSRYRRLDDGIVDRLNTILAADCSVPDIDAEKAIPWVEKSVGIQFETSQRNAISTALAGRISIITGGPGVGKTTILNGLIKILKAKKVKVALAAPTGRAARRMEESTGESADTLHKLLEFQPNGRFGRNRDKPLVAGAVICDEGSMIDVGLMFSLLQALPDTAKLIICGDRDQLPSVAAGQVLADLIDSGVVPVARLTEIFRQAKGSSIIRNAHRVNRGEVPDMDSGDPAFQFVETKDANETADTIVHLVGTQFARDRRGSVLDTQCMIPMRKGTVGVEQANARLQEAINPTPVDNIERSGRRFGVGDPVIQTRNNRDLMVFNGDIGVITRVRNHEKELLIDFDGQEVRYPFGELSKLDLAYCVTVHKSQGSQYGVVVVAVDTSNSILLSRKLLYTAITRATNKVVLVGQKRAVHIAVSAARAHERQTRLAEKLAASVLESE
ncbi:MAG: ATP-dependent RecD-like DNA helicase [Gammaproteobacteria bacterium]|nr:ATP-dependent RecD-like DNA helicase [Gammaproteobacteria bacterium]